jgi:hypothetical protein
LVEKKELILVGLNFYGEQKVEKIFHFIFFHL